MTVSNPSPEGNSNRPNTATLPSPVHPLFALTISTALAAIVGVLDSWHSAAEVFAMTLALLGGVRKRE